jgi:hypothetical protein
MKQSKRKLACRKLFAKHADIVTGTPLDPLIMKLHAP